MTIHANSTPYSKAFVRSCLLIFSWVFGLLVGYCLSKPLFTPMMRSAFLQPVSIVGLFVCIFLPLVLSCLFIYYEKPIFLLIVCFMKSAAYGFSCGIISHVYQSASWLLRFLFLFSDSCFLLVLLTLWIIAVSSSKPVRSRTLHVCAAIGMIVCFADFFIVSPFLERLL